MADLRLSAYYHIMCLQISRSGWHTADLLRRVHTQLCRFHPCSYCSIISLYYQNSLTFWKYRVHTHTRNTIDPWLYNCRIAMTWPPGDKLWNILHLTWNWCTVMTAQIQSIPRPLMWMLLTCSQHTTWTHPTTGYWKNIKGVIIE
jgi:hypothetical protein